MPDLRHISEDTTAFPWAKRTPGSGSWAVMAVAFALLMGHLTGHPAAGAIAAGAAFTVGFAAFHTALASTLLSMALTTLGIASATLAGSLAAPWTLVILALAFIAAINYGLLAGLGPTEGWIGQQCAVFVVVASYFSDGPKYAVGRTLMVLAGGGLQILVFSAVNLLQKAARTSANAMPEKQIPIRLRELLRCLRDEASFRGSTAAYVARLALALLLTTTIYKYLKVRNGYWMPMTALLVLKPEWANTLSRGIARLLGTMVGAGVALVVAMLLPVSNWLVLLLMVTGSTWACYALQAVNYALFSVFVTLYIVFLFHFGGFSETSAAHIRLVNTAVGGGLALVIDAVWKVVATRRGTARGPNPESVQ
jgi:hypothetical protein